ncbi:uncharacterized protein JCM6883_000767 [Sporobolomyces salmoneus]|uniref:uncharacterized protein n=1 Tax=Sporobolomyces salmoneus TaxID=183962 RepID=UPI003175FF37
MSAPPHDGWPRVGDVFSHWSDLVLAAQLAALREGYTGLGPSWRLDRPTTLWVACRVNSGTFRGKMGRCDLWLVRAVMVDSSNSESGWIVDTVRIENVPVGVHVEHQGGIGTSNGFSWVSMRDEAIGPYPVLEVGSDGEPIYPILADTKLSARLEIRRSALSKASEALSAARQSLLNLRTNVIALELVGDLDEAKALKKGIRTAEKVVVKKEKKWARKQAKVEKMKEKIERDTMKRRKLAGEKVTSSKIKKEKKEKKERKERKKEDKA